MGKALKGKELGTGISQRQDGLFQACFTNGFGKRQVIYDRSYNGIQKKMREAKAADDREIAPDSLFKGVEQYERATQIG